MKKILLFALIIAFSGCAKEEEKCTLTIVGTYKQGNVPFEKKDYCTGSDVAEQLCQNYRTSASYSTVICTYECYTP